jgi:hypothetical protein
MGTREEIQLHSQGIACHYEEVRIVSNKGRTAPNNATRAPRQHYFSVLENCSVDRLSRLAIQQLEITGQERHLDTYVELLKQNRLDENTSVEGLERVNNFFQKVYSTNLSTETFNCREALMETVHQLKEGFQWAQFNAHRLRFFLPEGPESESSDFAKQLQQVQSSINECESLCMRALNRVPAENDLMISAEVAYFLTCIDRDSFRSGTLF